MFKKGIVLLGIWAGLFAVSAAQAEELPNLFRGVRPLGMGGAFITLSNDENAMFYNPAGLNDVSGFGGLTILNPLGEISKNSDSLYKDLKDLDTNSESAVADFLSKMVGEHQHVRVAALPNLYMHNFAIGVLGQGTLDMEIRNRANPEVLTKIMIDEGVVASGALGFWDQMLQIGLTGKYFQRDGIDTVYHATDIAANNFDPLHQREKQSDFAFDLGAKVNFKNALKPNIALVVQNITDLDFKQLGVIPQEVNVGASVNPDFWILKTTFAVEVDDLTKNADADKDLAKRVHLGAEIRFPMILSLRAGLNGGYPSAGIGLNFWLLRVDAATYAEEIGAYAGQRSDRRYVVQASLGF